MMSPSEGRPVEPAPQDRRFSGRRRPDEPRPTHASWLASGEPALWFTAGALALAVAAIVGLMGLILFQGARTFWPKPILQIRTADGRVVAGEPTRRERFRPPAGASLQTRRLLRTGNFELSGAHFAWMDDDAIAEATEPPWMLTVEREAWGRFYGEPMAFLTDGQPTAEGPAATWEAFERAHPEARERRRQARAIERRELGRVNRRIEEARITARGAMLRHGADSGEARAAEAALETIQDEASLEFERWRARIETLDQENARYRVRLRAADGSEVALALDQIVRAYPANQLGLAEKLRLYLGRWVEFLSAEPREANSEGGVFPALFGTVAMTLIMCVLVVPLGVLAALYLREYARSGPLVSAVRISVNNLAGVPSIVFGVFGLGFFCYVVGAGIDELLFAEHLPNPTFGKGGLLWASLTLALLTLPVVIVATEEALAAVPNSLREGSYACGASRWQTIRRIVLPRALPGIMTGMILAVARGAGEVAPLMLVGAVKLAPALPMDSTAPFVHLERSFMHLGFHIYDLGFQSQNSEAAKPMVYSTTLLLIALIAALNAVASRVRARLRRRFLDATF